MDKDLHLKLTVRLYTDDNERFFGPGIATLLAKVREHHSLRAAAASMGMAYSKAWRIIRTAEHVFGCHLLSSTIGGVNGGGAVLTPQAEQILDAYESYCVELNTFGAALFDRKFAFFKDLEQL